jgi:hypothetical protein
MSHEDKWVTEQLEQTPAYAKLQEHFKNLVGYNPQAALAKDLKRRFKRRYAPSPHDERSELEELKHTA